MGRVAKGKLGEVQADSSKVANSYRREEPCKRPFDKDLLVDTE
jgi:hypothetical protein